MKVFVNSNNKPTVVAVKVRTTSPQNISIQLFDWKKPNTFYTKRKGIVKPKGTNVFGERLFYIRMPQSPKRGVLKIFNTKIGDKPKGVDTTFKVISLKMLPLERKLNRAITQNSNVQEFVKFAQQFSERAAFLSTGGSVYFSDNGKFRIDYYDDIISRKSGRVLKTPARVSTDHGYIEISKKQFLKYTIPMRMAILLHEFAHYYMSDQVNNETEADLNALMVFLGLGYPRIDGHNAFLQVFKGTPSDENRIRHGKIKDFIEGFEQIDFKPV